MSLSTTISLSSASARVGQLVMATMTVTNASASAINILSAQPTCRATGNAIPLDASSAVLGDVPLSQGFSNSVPGSGTLSLQFSFAVNSPSTGNSDTGSGTYDIGCNMLAANGETPNPTPATITVHPVLPIF